MITPKMKEFLESLPKNPKEIRKTVKHCVYLNRMQKRIDRELKMALWLAVNHPEILLDRGREYSDDTGKIMSHRRLKKLLLIVKALNPKIEVELVLKNLEFPDNLEIG